MKTNVFVLTCKGRKDLTEQCFRSIKETISDYGVPAMLVLIDAGQGAEALKGYEVVEWLNDLSATPKIYVVYENIPCTLTQGWNKAIEWAQTQAQILAHGSPILAEDINIHLLQNDSIFLKPGWLKAIMEKMDEPNIGSVGTSGMAVFGHGFVTGAIQSFNLANGLAIAENGKVIDEHFNHAFPDVDLCIRFARAGFHNTVVADMEHGDNPSVRHLVSQTMYSEHGIEQVMKWRAEEEEYFLHKWGKAE